MARPPGGAAYFVVVIIVGFELALLRWVEWAFLKGLPSTPATGRQCPALVHAARGGQLGRMRRELQGWSRFLWADAYLRPSELLSIRTADVVPPCREPGWDVAFVSWLLSPAKGGVHARQERASLQLLSAAVRATVQGGLLGSRTEQVGYDDRTPDMSRRLGLAHACLSNARTAPQIKRRGR